ncbi:hypothetical protein ACJX0J_008215, partial [Zea mays]
MVIDGDKKNPLHFVVHLRATRTPEGGAKERKKGAPGPRKKIDEYNINLHHSQSRTCPIQQSDEGITLIKALQLRAEITKKKNFNYYIIFLKI